jgi:hypothetical protein
MGGILSLFDFFISKKLMFIPIGRINPEPGKFVARNQKYWQARFFVYGKNTNNRS